MGNQLMATYYIYQQTFYIYGCWDKETPENKFDFFDLYDKQGSCLNEGDPFFEFPTYDEIKDFVDTIPV